MIALFFLFLTLSVSPFKSKSRLEPSSTDCAAAQGAGSRPAHKWGSLVLGPAVSMVSIGAQGQVGDRLELIDARVPQVASSMEISRAADRLIPSAPALLAATTTKERDAV